MPESLAKTCQSPIEGHEKNCHPSYCTNIPKKASGSVIWIIHQNRRKKESRRGGVNENSIKVLQEKRELACKMSKETCSTGFLVRTFFFLFKMVEFNGLKEKIFEGPESCRRQ